MNATEPFTTELDGFETGNALMIPEQPGLPAAPDENMPSSAVLDLSAAEKASIVLIALGPSPAADLLRAIGASRVRRFAGIVNDMAEIDPEVVDSVINEFLGQLGNSGTISGGREELRRFLSEVVDKEQLNQILDDVDNAGRSVWSILSDVDNARIATWLQEEHPQVAAIVLSKLTSAKAAAVLENFEPEQARGIILRMEHAAEADDSIINQIGKVIEEDFLPAVAQAENSQNPADLIAAVMNLSLIHISEPTRPY